jgi:hypothetical protein
MNIYAIDIETTGLDALTDRVTTFACYSPTASVVIEDTDERRLLAAAQEWVAKLDAGMLVGWNSAVFDFPFLSHRHQINRVLFGYRLTPDPDIVPKYEPVTGFEGGVKVSLVAAGGYHEHVDIAYRYRDWTEANQVKWSLKPVARAHGIDVIEVEREHMERLGVAQRMAYGLSDVVATYELAVRLGDKLWD